MSSPVSLLASNTTQSSTSTPAAAASAPSNMLNGNDFMTLLVAQLKAQDPTSPMDPTQFVGQLVQFNSLQQLININKDLTPPATTTPPTTTTPPGTTLPGTKNANSVVL